MHNIEKTTSNQTCCDCEYLLRVLNEGSNDAESYEYFCTANPEPVEKPEYMISRYRCRFYKYQGASSTRLLERHERL